MKNTYLFIAGLCAFVYLMLVGIGCSTMQYLEPERVGLYWENTTEPHPERAPWTDSLVTEIKNNISTYDLASDMESICPKYHSLTLDQKTKAIGELFVAMTYYESGFKPQSIYRECNKNKCQYSNGCQTHVEYGYCMKGGHALDGGIVISRGLLQISLESAKGYGCKVNKPDDLHEPIQNLVCGQNIMSRQIIRTGKITTTSNYWAVVKPNSTHNKVSDIKARVQKHASFCN